MANIFDVALLAGVSHQTVSRVVNGDPNVRPATRQKVDAAIAELNYRPSAAARALASRKTRALGLISTGGPLFGPSSIMQGFDGAAREAGYQVSIATIGRSDPAAMRVGMRAAVDALLGQNVEAIVLIAPDSRAIDAVRELSVAVPLVTADAGEHDGLVSVSLDQYAGARRAVEHLASLGHSAVMHLAGPLDWNDAVERERGWRASCDDLGLTALEPMRGDWSPESGYRLGLALTDRVRSAEVTAIFSSNDQMALGLLHAFAEQGVDVPGQVSIVGFDDVPEAAHFIPPLTTVRQDFGSLGRQIMSAVEAQIGQVAVAAVDSAGSASRAAGALATPELVVRASTAVAP